MCVLRFLCKRVIVDDVPTGIVCKIGSFGLGRTVKLIGIRLTYLAYIDPFKNLEEITACVDLQTGS